MNPRFQAIANVQQTKTKPSQVTFQTFSEGFGSHVFNLGVMKQKLPKEVFENVVKAREGLEPIKVEYADKIASALQEWAISLGATHYSHWFQPLTGATAEKHDAFIDWGGTDQIIEKFSGKQLVQGEPDASSFPSGGLRSTYEARGYTGWDPSSFPFIWKAGDGITLCIPSVFFSWTGDVLDTKIPLLRSDQQISKACLRLLKLANIKANYVYSTLGLEQEYFVIDRSFRNLRPDIILTGRTVYGAPSPKGQELQDHYFGSVKDRILSFMSDFEEEAIKLGIPIKTRHNEVAPSQHEVAPVYEKSSRAVDHNILLMELMRRIASKHGLSCLLHEKPFQGINGSGKHMNWSLSTDTGVNLLDPSDTPGNNLSFVVLLTAILQGVYRHSSLLRASIGTASNDFRLGGHEAPPAIISAYLGQELENLLEQIEKKGFHLDKNTKNKYDLGLSHLPDLTKDHTDRNRTSPFAFTGNKFEFRALGSSNSPALAATVLNLIVAESLNEIVDDIEKELKTKDLPEATLSVVRKSLLNSKPIRFIGDNYSEEWVKEAAKRGIANHQKSVYAYEAFKTKATFDLFKNVLREHELLSRYEILMDIYISQINIEVNVMLDMFYTIIYPAAIRYQTELAKAIKQVQEANVKSSALKAQDERLTLTIELIGDALYEADALKSEREKAHKSGKKGEAYAEKVLEKAFELRAAVDKLELVVDDKLWPLPKYREILFIS